MSDVVIMECQSYDVDKVINKINAGMEQLGGWDKYVKPGMKVLLKVNLIGPKTPDTAGVTHCEFVRAITRILKSKKCTVWIGDSSGGAIAGISPTARSLEVSGLERIAHEEGAEIKNFDKEGVVEAKSESGILDRMYIAKPMFEADLVINLPKLKTHSSAIYTGAVKNLFGCIPGLKKAEYHRTAPDPKQFGNLISDIHKAVKIGLNIMDGITAMQGEGPTAGEVYPAGKILISTDPLALDTAASAMLGLNIEDIPILMTARERNIGESHIENINISGDYTKAPKLSGFKLPKSFGKTGKKNYAVLVKLIDFMKTKPVVNRKLCKNCNTCVESCPIHAIDRNTKTIDYSKCIECLCCHELCMYKAVELKRSNPLAGVIMKLYRGNYR